MNLIRERQDPPSELEPLGLLGSDQPVLYKTLIGSRSPAIFGGSISRIYVHFINPNGGRVGEAPPEKIRGPRGGAPRIFLILGIRNIRFSLKDSQ